MVGHSAFSRHFKSRPASRTFGLSLGYREPKVRNFARSELASRCQKSSGDWTLNDLSCFWTPDAEHRLEKILENDPNAHDLAMLAREIDRVLVNAPYELGESRYESVRVGFLLPLAVEYEVLDDVRTVIVFDVWRPGRQD